MRIEVLVGSEDPVLFPLKSSKVTIGSGENCDIILSAGGVSRKHLIISVEDEQYFVLDQGSTNGTFINEERLIPGRKTEFTSFFPVRLGEDVLISLLSDEDGFIENEASSPSIILPNPQTSPSIKIPVKERDDSTTVININDLRKVKTETLVLERNKKREIRKKVNKKAAPKPKKKINYVSWLAIFIVAGAGYYNFFLSERTDNTPQIREVGKEYKAPVVKQKPEVNLDLIEENDLPTKDYVSGLLHNIKCAIDVEKYLCSGLPSTQHGLFGAVQVGLTMYVLVDASKYLERARSQTKFKEDIGLINQIAAFLFLKEELPILDLNLMGDSRLMIGLFDSSKDNNDPRVETIIAIRPAVFNRDKSKLTDDTLRYVKSVGDVGFNQMKKIYTVY